MAVSVAAFLLIAALSIATTASGTSFPHFRDYDGQAYTVGYNERAMTLNGAPVLFLSGSVHPPRLSVEEWDQVMEDTIAAGLNMIEV